MHEVTTFRRDVKTDGRHAEVEFGVSLDDDLARRDFTINAIAYSPSRNETRDPFDGQRDLQRRVVRAVGEPEARMREDRLRALRGIRFAARFDFRIDDATWRAIVNSAPHMGRLSAERVKQEIEKTVDQVVAPSRAFTHWEDGGAFAVLVPLLAGAPPERFAATDALAQPGRVARRPARRMLRIASLFLGLPAGDVRETLRRLRFSNADINAISRIGDGWTAVADEMRAALFASAPADAQVRRWVASVGRTQWTLVMRIAAAVWAHEPIGRAVPALYRRGARIAFRDPIELADLAVDGDDLRVAGVANGPAIGKWLQRLMDIVIEDPSQNQRGILLGLVERGAA
jgi:tRNA nucleotidyltransferase (CCA-adding enzyme)